MPRLRSQISNLYILPYIILLIGRTYVFGGSADINSNDNSIFKTIILAVGYVIAFTLIVKKFNDFKRLFTALFPLFLYALYSALTLFWSSYPDVVIFRALHTVGLGFIALCTGVWAREREDSIFSVTMVFMLIVLTLSLLCVIFLPARGLVYPELGMYSGSDSRWIGITASPNHLGAIAFIGIWASLAVISLERRYALKVMAVFSIIIAAIDLRGSDSRTSEICVTFLFLMFFLMRGKVLKSSAYAKRAAPLACVGLLVMGAVYMVNPEYIVNHFFPTTRQGAGDALSDRPIIWAKGIDAVLNNPMGWSYDLLQTYWDEHTAPFRFPHLHNGFLDVAVKGGVIGEILLLFILFKMATSYKRLYKLNYLLFKGFVLFLFANLLYNITETGFDREEPLWPMMVVAWACAEAKNNGRPKPPTYVQGENGLIKMRRAA